MSFCVKMCRLKTLRVPSFLLILTILICSDSIPSSLAAGKRALYPDFSCHASYNDNRGSGNSPSSGSLLVEAIEKECGHDKNPNGCNKACVWEKHNILLKHKGKYDRNLGDALDINMALTKLFKPGSRDFSQIVRNLRQCLQVLNGLDQSKTDPCDNNGWASVFECLDTATGCMPLSRGQLMGCYDNDNPATWKVRSGNSIRATAHCCEHRIMNCYKYDYQGNDQKVCQVESNERKEQLKQCCDTSNLVSYIPADPRDHGSTVLTPC